MNTTSGEMTAPDGHSLPSWQRASIRKLEFGGFAAAIVSMIVVVTIGRFTHHPNHGAMFAPWIVVVSMMIPIAYRRGVRDARAHSELVSSTHENVN
jgi:hypothetical protein